MKYPRDFLRKLFFLLTMNRVIQCIYTCFVRDNINLPCSLLFFFCFAQQVGTKRGLEGFVEEILTGKLDYNKWMRTPKINSSFCLVKMKK